MERKTWWQFYQRVSEPESLIFQLLVLLENGNRNGHTQTASVLIICPLTSIINGRICEVESMGLSACNLSQKDLTVVEVAKCLFAQKLGPNRSEMEVRTFVSIKTVI